MSRITENVLKYSSISIVGMEKNTGKTECLNYLITQLNKLGKSLLISSIGIDGESYDRVTQTSKPEITLQSGNIFVTSEHFYRIKSLTAEILDVSESSTATGRLITAKTLLAGKVIIAGPVDTTHMKQFINKMSQWNADIMLIDGALSRKSLGAPSVTEAMILTTGAALSPNIVELVRKTSFNCQLINLPCYETAHQETLLEQKQGIWAITQTEIRDLHIASSLLLEKMHVPIFAYGHTLFVSGMVTDKLLNFLRKQKEIAHIVLIVKDFTKLFITPEAYCAFTKKGGKIKVLLKTHLIAVCANPVSPQGYTLDSHELCSKLTDALQLPVYDIRREK
ncbi:MAG: hypothetical protein LBL18_00320 [Bacteroidales bacterium]|nr:hypothetical protein [Bacteroidales bacterium]